MRLTARSLALLASTGILALADQPSCGPGADGGSSCLKAKDTDEEASLLQTRRDGEEWWGPQYYVQMNPPDKLPIDRTVLKEGLVRELLIKYPLNDQIQVSGNKATIKMHEIMTGTYARDSHGEGAVAQKPFHHTFQDYGVEKGVLFVTPQSMVSNKVKLAFAEKSHALWVQDEDKMMRNSEVVNTAGMEAQTEKQKKQAIKDRSDRNGALSTLSLSQGPQILMNGKDWNHIDEQRNFTAKHRKPSKQEMTDMDRMRQILNERQAQYTAKIPIHSTIGCLHFEGAELMTFEENKVTVPLDTNIVAWRGQLGSSPNDWYSMASGIMYFHVNEEDKSLEIYFRFSTSIDITDQSTPKKDKWAGALIVGPVNGEKKNKVGKESRLKSFSIPFFTANTWAEVQKYQVDYTFLHSKREDVGCSDKVLDGLPAKVDKFQDGFVMGQDGQTKVRLTDGWHATLMEEVNCAVEYLKPVDDSVVLSYGRLLASGLIHVLIEMPGSLMVAAFSNSAMWNEFALP